MEKRQQLCWSCKKACGGKNGCSWFNGHIPIQGWQATPTISDNVVIDGKVRLVHSFMIKKCPLFVGDSKVLVKSKSNKDKAKELGVSERTYYRRKSKRRKYDKV